MAWRGASSRPLHEKMTLIVLIIAIGLSNWAQYARTVRGSTLVEKRKDYVEAARVIGLGAFPVMLKHVCPTWPGRCS